MFCPNSGSHARHFSGYYAPHLYFCKTKWNLCNPLYRFAKTIHIFPRHDLLSAAWNSCRMWSILYQCNTTVFALIFVVQRCSLAKILPNTDMWKIPFFLCHFYFTRDSKYGPMKNTKLRWSQSPNDTKPKMYCYNYNNRNLLYRVKINNSIRYCQYCIFIFILYSIFLIIFTLLTIINFHLGFVTCFV